MTKFQKIKLKINVFLASSLIGEQRCRFLKQGEQYAFDGVKSFTWAEKDSCALNRGWMNTNTFGANTDVCSCTVNEHEHGFSKNYWTRTNTNTNFFETSKPNERVSFKLLNTANTNEHEHSFIIIPALNSSLKHFSAPNMSKTALKWVHFDW